LPQTEIQDEVINVEELEHITASHTAAVKSVRCASGVKARSLPPQTRERQKIHILEGMQERVVQKDAQVQVTAEKLTDLAVCVKNFKVKIKIAESLPDSKRFDFLNRSIQSCCPPGKKAGDFTLLVLQHLRRTQLSPNTIVSCLVAANVPLPDLGTSRGLELVRQLNDMAKNSAKMIRPMDRLYRVLAATVTTNSTGKPSVQDKGIRMLYRAIWENALRSRKDDQPFETSTVMTLNALGKRFSNPHTHFYLKRLLNDRAHTADQIDHLVRSSSGRRRSTIVGAPVLDCIPRELLSTAITSLPRYLVKEVDDQNERQKLRHFESWMRVLRVLDARVATAPENITTLDLAVKSLAADGVHLLVVGRYLMYLPPELLVKALLHWLPYQESMYGIEPKQREEFVTLYRIHLRTNGKLLVSRNEMLARLLARMQQHGLPNHEMANLIIKLVYRHKGIRSVLDMLRRLKRKGVGLSDTEFLYEFLGKLEPGTRATQASTSLYGHDDAFTLHAAQSIRRLELDENVTDRKLDKKLVSWQSRRQFKHIMQGARDARLLPLVYRKLDVDALMNIRADIIHQIAYQYSLERSRTSQQNWRSIYYLYKYLHDNELPIGPLFTNAVMRVCIIQPLSEKRFVSARRLTWVCQMIAPVEGVDVAKKIEHIFGVWRGDLIQHAKRTLYASGGMGKAHVSTMKKLGLL
jgi:hypothetical protein